MNISINKNPINTLIVLLLVLTSIGILAVSCVQKPQYASESPVESVEDINDHYYPLSSFMKHKETTKFHNDENKFFSYPIWVVDNTDHRAEYFIQDVKEWYVDSVKHLQVVLLSSDTTTLYQMKKECIMPEDSYVPWDLIHCNYKFNLK